MGWAVSQKDWGCKPCYVRGYRGHPLLSMVVGSGEVGCWFPKQRTGISQEGQDLLTGGILLMSISWAAAPGRDVWERGMWGYLDFQAQPRGFCLGWAQFAQSWGRPSTGCLSERWEKPPLSPDSASPVKGNWISNFLAGTAVPRDKQDSSLWNVSRVSIFFFF